MAQYIKDPDAQLEYGFDWTPWLTQASDTLATSTWIVPAGITNLAEYRDGNILTVKLGGGTNGTRYVITNRITTAGGRIDDRSFPILVTDR